MIDILFVSIVVIVFVHFFVVDNIVAILTGVVGVLDVVILVDVLVVVVTDC